MGALGGRDGGRVGGPGHERQLPSGRRAEVYPRRAAVRPGRPSGAAGDVVSGNDAWQRHDHPPSAVQAGVLRQQQRY